MQGSASCVYLQSMVKQKVRHRHFILFTRRMKVMGTFGDVQGQNNLVHQNASVSVAECGLHCQMQDCNLDNWFHYFFDPKMQQGRPPL